MPHLIMTAILALTLLGCANFSEKIEPPPLWYTSPLVNTEQHYYGQGEGKTLAEARTAARVNLQQRLGLAKPVHVSNFSVIDGKRIGQEQWIMQIAVEPWQFKTELEFHIKNALKTQKSTLEQTILENPLKRYYVSVQVLTELAEQKNRIKVLHDLTKSNAIKTYLAQVSAMEKIAKEYRSALFFTVESNSNAVFKVMTAQLNKQGFVVKKDQQSNSNKIALKLSLQQDVQKEPNSAAVSAQLLVQ
ncbi:MAG: hypothetical protein RL217_619, partial [Pseudomonadota bacterium]